MSDGTYDGTDDDDTHDGGTTPPPTIICVDCGGTCHLLSHPDPDISTGFSVGDIVAYRCGDCLDRWDVELA